LRHEPRKFDLSPDGDGYVPIDSLLDQIKRKDRWHWVTKQHLIEVVERSEKKRFEIVSNKIWALYGHIFEKEIHYRSVTPPEYLFHRTARRNIEKIEQEGLLSMKRQHVHLSVTPEDAYKVGLRRDKNPLILKVSALNAHNQGIKFYKAGDLFLVKRIPRKYLTIV
jgi:putative RNA 2'-phosphotransferase